MHNQTKPYYRASFQIASLHSCSRSSVLRASTTIRN
jgi:hypothetical protein